jgi:2-(1,2-epoxy-1,2-dihydrophenyl)acetyl-CoA isomerase
VVTLTLDRPERLNAFNDTMWEEIGSVLDEVAASPEDRVLVVTGAAGAFSSGADLTERALVARHPLHFMRAMGDVLLRLHRLPQPTIAKVRGVAVGAGCNLALGCDLVVAADDSRFSEIFSRRGLAIDAGGSWLLPRRVGLHRAKEIAFFGEILSAEQVAALGLVNRVVPAADLDGFVDAWASRLAEGPPLALSMTKALLNESFSMSMSEALEREAEAQSVNFATEDTKEAIRAFGEKREPRFVGR